MSICTGKLFWRKPSIVRLTIPWCALFLLICLLNAPGWTTLSANAQGNDLVRKVDSDIVAEEGSPVIITSARTELDLDPFGAPITARTYVDYKNVSSKEVAATKFRIRYVDVEGNDKGTFQAPDSTVVAPGSTGSQKWRTNRVDPAITKSKIRILMVKYSDGTIWESTRTPSPTTADSPVKQAP